MIPSFFTAIERKYLPLFEKSLTTLQALYAMTATLKSIYLKIQMDDMDMSDRTSHTGTSTMDVLRCKDAALFNLSLLFPTMFIKTCLSIHAMALSFGKFHHYY